MKAHRNPQAKALNTYRTVASDLRRLLMLGDIAAEYGNGRRAAQHLIGGLRELVPDLRELRAEASRRA